MFNTILLVNTNEDISLLIEKIERKILSIAKSYYNNVALAMENKINWNVYEDLSDYKLMLINRCSDCFSGQDIEGIKYQLKKLLNTLC